MKNYKVALVVPVHIDLNPKWIDAVYGLDVDVIIVDDSDGKVKFPEKWIRLDYGAQKILLKGKYQYWTKFQKSSSCKNIGHYYAYLQDYDIIMGLDSDCIPSSDFVTRHIQNLESGVPLWENPLEGTGWFSRGFPYSARKGKCALSMGLWTNELDLYGKDRVDDPYKQTNFPDGVVTRTAQGYIPLSGMNWATWRENIPLLLFLPNHDNFRRHDDIWGGYIFQKAMAEKGERIVYGQPFVYHDTTVDAQADANEEEAMMEYEDEFFKSIDEEKPWPWVKEALQFWQSLYD